MASPVVWILLSYWTPGVKLLQSCLLAHVSVDSENFSASRKTKFALREWLESLALGYGKYAWCPNAIIQYRIITGSFLVSPSGGIIAAGFHSKVS